MAEGLKITLEKMPHGLTVNKSGRQLLPSPFVFQCPPMEQYTLAHTFNFGTYDTIDNDQFSRRGSRQLDTWQFDTLVMYLGVTLSRTRWVDDPHRRTTRQKQRDKTHPPHATGISPAWVPFAHKQPGASRQFQMRRPEWYVEQLRHLFDAGAPFRYTAAFHGGQGDNPTIHRCYAVLTAFNEDYKHGEGDAIYLSSVSFMEWRDPRGDTSPKFPAHVRFRKSGNRYIAYNIKNGRNVKTKSKTKGTTFADLSRDFYGTAGDWRHIVKANKLKGGAGDTPIFEHWYAKKKLGSVTVKIPKKPN